MIPKTYAVSCIRSDSGTTTVNSACTLDGIPKYNASGIEISRVGIINGGDLTISGADATVQPNTVIVWPIGKAINIQNGARLILGSGASLTQAEPLTYQFQSLGFTVNAAGDPVKVVNNVLQVCTNTTCSIAAPTGTGHAVVEGQLKVGSTFIIDGSGNVGIGTTSPLATLDIAGSASASGNLTFRGTGTAHVLNLYDNGSLQIGNSVGGGTATPAFVVTSAGQVGVGTTNPLAKFEVAGNINSSTGALQTAGITRVDNTGVGTFAAGTTIGGSAVTAAVVDNSLANGRLTLTSGTPVTTSDVTLATTVYYTPYNGNRISLYDGTSTWTTLTFSELSLALTSYTANTNYDIWAYNNSGTVALESTAWTNDTTRATAIVQQNGVWVKTGATTRRLLGTIRITGTIGQTEDSRRNRLVFNVNNRVNRAILLTYTGSWYEEGYYTAWRYLNNDSTQFIGVVRSLDEDVISMDMTSARRVVAPSFDGSAYYAWAHAEISIDTPGLNTTGNAAQGADGYSGSQTMTAHYSGYPGAGYHKVIPSIYVSFHSYYGGAEYLNTTIGGDNGVGTKGGATGTAMQ